MIRKIPPAAFAAFLLIPGMVCAATEESRATEIDEIVVTGVRQRLDQAGALADVIARTELIGSATIEGRQALSLTDAIADSPGVRVSNECSMCGVKRLMLNGLRGEHTTILTDGLPLHTMVSGFYALDALVMTGVQRIEVARGAGASMTAPEAVGGTINVISVEPVGNELELDGAVETDGGYLGSMLATRVSADGRTRLSAVVQLNEHEQVDSDRNGVNEAPRQTMRSYILRLSNDIGERDNVVLRAAHTDYEIFGGPMGVRGIGEVLAGFDDEPSEQLFENDDVRQRFVGKPWETTEWIDTQRTELSAVWLREFNSRLNGTFSAGYARHEQDSFYEGFDYRAQDDLLYFDMRGNYSLGTGHLLTFGLDRRAERMRSESDAGEASPDYVADSFDYDVTGVYLQDTWTVTKALEVALALRVDRVVADFVAPEKLGREIVETVLAPRVDARYRHDPYWTSRLSLGRGYRAPLSFFESDHGILDAGRGFAIDINDLERSFSTSYALSFEGERLTATASVTHTRVDNLAALDETETGVPLLTQLDTKAAVLASDLALGYRFGSWLRLGVTLESFDYDADFRSAFGIAPIERRATVVADASWGPWTAYATAAWIGSRDLEKYGYEGFNVLGDPTPKSTSAPAYWMVDLRVARDFGDRTTLYVGAKNLFDKTQAGDMDSPLFWGADGSFDVGYIYGPLRGRELYAGAQLRF